MSGQQFDLNPLVTALVGGAGGIGAAFWLLRAVVRRLSRDKVELTSDRAEAKLVNTLSESNSTLGELNAKLVTQIDVLSREKNEVLVAKGQLEIKVSALQQRVDTLEKEGIYLRTLLTRYAKSATPSSKEQK